MSHGAHRQPGRPVDRRGTTTSDGLACGPLSPTAERGSENQKPRTRIAGAERRRERLVGQAFASESRKANVNMAIDTVLSVSVTIALLGMIVAEWAGPTASPKLPVYLRAELLLVACVLLCNGVIWIPALVR